MSQSDGLNVPRFLPWPVVTILLGQLIAVVAFGVTLEARVSQAEAKAAKFERAAESVIRLEEQFKGQAALLQEIRTELRSRP
jgi:hypothetical protein